MRSIACGMALALLLVPLAAAGSDWVTFRGDPRRTGNADGTELPRPSLRLAWRFEGSGYTAPAFDSSPAVSGDRVYLGVAEQSIFSPSGRIVALDLADGKLVWDRKTRYPVFSSPAVAGGRVFVGEGYHQDSRCRLYAYDAASGAELWTFETKSHIESSPHVEKDRVYFGAGGAGIYCLEAKDGTEVWRFAEEHVDVSPLVSSGMVFAGSGYGDFAAFALSAADGKPRWRTPVDLPVWGSPLLLGNRLFLGLGKGQLIQSAPEPKGAVVCLAATSGKEVWRRDLPDAVMTAIAYAKERLLFGCRDGHLYALEPADGAIAWKRPLGAAVVSSPVIGGRLAAAVSLKGRLVMVDAASGEETETVDLRELIGLESVTVISSPSAAGGRLILGTRGAGAVALGPAE